MERNCLAENENNLTLLNNEAAEIWKQSNQQLEAELRDAQNAYESARTRAEASLNITK